MDVRLDDDSDKSSPVLSFHRLPETLINEIQVLQELVVDDPLHSFESCSMLDQIVQARLKLQAWFHETFPQYSHYKLRHIIPRSTRIHAVDGTNDNANKHLLAIQQPVQRFHTDSTHTDFVNIWLPLSKHEPITNHWLGFLCNSRHLVTASTVAHEGDDPSSSFWNQCHIVYHPLIRTFGDAIVFQSGGADGIMHGSFCLGGAGQTAGHRESVEFRCQAFDATTNLWVYGQQQAEQM